jgi:hypothetical protein
MYGALQRDNQVLPVQSRPGSTPPQVAGAPAVQEIPDTVSPFMVPEVQGGPVILLAVTAVKGFLRVGFTGGDPQEAPGTGLKLKVSVNK